MTEHRDPLEDYEPPEPERLEQLRKRTVAEIIAEARALLRGDET